MGTHDGYREVEAIGLQSEELSHRLTARVVAAGTIRIGPTRACTHERMSRVSNGGRGDHDECPDARETCRLKNIAGAVDVNPLEVLPGARHVHARCSVDHRVAPDEGPLQFLDRPGDVRGLTGGSCTLQGLRHGPALHTDDRVTTREQRAHGGAPDDTGRPRDGNALSHRGPLPPAVPQPHARCGSDPPWSGAAHPRAGNA